jgi:hypothetical protein
VYVYVTVTELQGPSRLRDLGELPDQTSLDQIRAWVASSIEGELREFTRKDPRHFWHNDQIQRNRTLLSDLASAGGTVSLELRPDLYCVAAPGESGKRWAFNPEGGPDDFVHHLLEGRHGGQCCYELRLADGTPLRPDADLISQGALPRADIPSHVTPSLLLRHRPAYFTFVTSAVALAAVAGLVLGYLSNLIR